MIRAVRLWLPVLAYMAVIFVFSSMSAPPGPEGWLSDKAQHGLAYGGLAVVTLRATSGGRWWAASFGAIALAWVIATAYGVTDEIHQGFTPGRTPDLLDLRADAVGAAVGLGLARACGIIWRFVAPSRASSMPS
jgi:VanZ family protein